METGIESIYNYLYWNESLSSSGKPTLEQLTAIAEAGFEVLINLLPLDQTPAEEPDLIKNKGLEYVSIPVFWDSPEQYDIAQFFQAMNQAQGKRVFVHCAANMRATAFLYLYHVLILKQNEPEIRAMMHRIWEPNPIWSRFIEQTLSRYTK